MVWNVRLGLLSEIEELGGIEEVSSLFEAAFALESVSTLLAKDTRAKNTQSAHLAHLQRHPPRINPCPCDLATFHYMKRNELSFGY